MKFAFLLLFLVFQEPSEQQQSEIIISNEGQLYYCPPCGCDSDHNYFPQSGECPSCGMHMIPKPDGTKLWLVEHTQWLYAQTDVSVFLLNKILYPGLFLGIALTLLAFIFKRNHANKFLYLFILSIALYPMQQILWGHCFSIFNQGFALYYLPLSFITALGPLFYLFIRSSFNLESQRQSKFYFHFGPAILFFFVHLNFFISPQEEKSKMIMDPNIDRILNIENLVAFIIAVIYLTRIYKLFQLVKVNSNGARKVYQTIKWVVSGYEVLLVFWFFVVGLNIWVFDFRITQLANYSLWFSFGLMVYYLIFLNVKFQGFFPVVTQRTSYNRGLSDNEIETLKAKLDYAMQSENIYRDINLSLSDLAYKFETDIKTISMIVNIGMGKSFYEYINEYRIEEFKTKILDSEFDHLTFEAIAASCGFKSKSSFNAAFKRHTGVTPREFKKSRMAVN